LLERMRSGHWPSPPRESGNPRDNESNAACTLCVEPLPLEGPTEGALYLIFVHGQLIEDGLVLTVSVLAPVDVKFYSHSSSPTT
jgi:hypothetical protein